MGRSLFEIQDEQMKNGTLWNPSEQDKKDLQEAAEEAERKRQAEEAAKRQRELQEKVRKAVKLATTQKKTSNQTSNQQIQPQSKQTQEMQNAPSYAEFLPAPDPKRMYALKDGEKKPGFWKKLGDNTLGKIGEFNDGLFYGLKSITPQELQNDGSPIKNLYDYYNNLDRNLKYKAYETNMKIQMENARQEEEYFKQREAQRQAFEGVKDEEDFDEYSLQGRLMENPTPEEVFGHPFIKPKINNKVEYQVAYALSPVKELEQIVNQDPGNAPTKEQKYAYMSEDERDVYAYYLTKYGEKRAEDYLDFLARDLDERFTKDHYSKVEKEAEEHKIQAAGRNIASSPWKILSLWDVGKQAIKNGVTGEYEPTNPYTNTMGAYHMGNATEEGITNDMGPAGKTATKIGLGIGQNAILLPFFKAAPVLSALGTAGETAADSTERGARPEEALMNAGLAGGIDYGIGKIPLDEVVPVKGLKPGSFKEQAAKLGTNAVANFAGGAGQEYATTIVDNLTTGDKSEYYTYVNALIAQGMEPEEAEKEAMIAFYLKKPVVSGGINALSSAGNDLYHTGQAALGSGDRTGKAATIIAAALAEEGSTSKQALERLTNETLNDVNLGRLRQAVIKEYLRNRLKSNFFERE